METASVLWIIEQVYATFGKSAPKQGSGQYQVVHDILVELPNECAKYIVRKAADLDDMPRNLGKFFRQCWNEWKAENPGSIYNVACGTCGGSGGWIYFRREETLSGSGTEWHEYFSPCPSCTWIPSRLRDKVRPCCRTPWDLEGEGCIVMPAGYPGGVLQFISDKGLGDKVRSHDENPYDKRLDRLMASLGREMTIERGVTEPGYGEAWA